MLSCSNEEPGTFPLDKSVYIPRTYYFPNQSQGYQVSVCQKTMKQQVVFLFQLYRLLVHFRIILEI